MVVVEFNVNCVQAHFIFPPEIGTRDLIRTTSVMVTESLCFRTVSVKPL